MSEVNSIRRALRLVMSSGAAVVLMSVAGSVSVAGILPGNFLPNPDMETETQFVAHQIEGPTTNSFADYWHHSLWAGWNAPGDPVLSGLHSLRLVDEVDTTGGPFEDPNGPVPPQDGTLQQQEFRTFATDIPADAGSPTGKAETLYFRWNWNYQIDSGSTPEFVMNVRFSNAPNFSLDLGPALGDNFTVATGSSNGLWEEVTIELAVPAGAQTFDILFLTEGSPDALGSMFIDDVSVSTIAPLLDGDLDGDGFVGINDLNIVLGNWNLNVPPGNPLADPSGDGFVGIDDLNTVLGNWNAGTPPAAGVVPEPTTLAVLGLGGLALLRRRG
jgi:PEP-CTERM motif-containing protein